MSFQLIESALLAIHNDQICSIDRGHGGQVASSALVNLSFALDTVDHDILLLVAANCECTD